MLRKTMLVTGSIVGLALAALPVLAQDSVRAPAQNARQGDPYLLDVCPVSKEKLGSMGDPVVKIHEGREVRFCCKGCVKEFDADPAAVLKVVDELTVKNQLPFYPAKLCIVSDEPLEKAVDVVYMNRLVRLCCKGCKKQLAADPKTLMAKLDKAVVAQQREHYPLTTCPLSGETLDAEAVEMVYGNRLMRFCCKRCVAGFEKNPTAHVAALDKAWMAKHGHGHEHGEHGAHGEHGGHGEHGAAGHDGHGDHGHSGGGSGG